MPTLNETREEDEVRSDRQFVEELRSKLVIAGRTPANEHLYDLVVTSDVRSEPSRIPGLRQRLLF